MYKLVIERGHNLGESLILQEGENTVGRHSSSGLRLTEPDVSRHHLVLRRTGTQVTVESLGVRGTLLNGRELTTATPMIPGQTLQIGAATILRLDYAETPSGQFMLDSDDTGGSRSASSMGTYPNTSAYDSSLGPPQEETKGITPDFLGGSLFDTQHPTSRDNPPPAAPAHPPPESGPPTWPEPPPSPQGTPTPPPPGSALDPASQTPNAWGTPAPGSVRRPHEQVETMLLIAILACLVLFLIIFLVLLLG